MAIRRLYRYGINPNEDLYTYDKENLSLLGLTLRIRFPFLESFSNRYCTVKSELSTEKGTYPQGYAQALSLPP